MQNGVAVLVGGGWILRVISKHRSWWDSKNVAGQSRKGPAILWSERAWGKGAPYFTYISKKQWSQPQGITNSPEYSFAEALLWSSSQSHIWLQVFVQSRLRSVLSIWKYNSLFYICFKNNCNSIKLLTKLWNVFFLLSIWWEWNVYWLRRAMYLLAKVSINAYTGR